MKTNFSFRMFKLSVLAPLGVAVVAAFVTQPVRATAIDSLVITENSSTSLTATLTLSNGTISSPMVTPAFPGATDEWTIALTGVSAAVSGSNASQSWLEPDAAGFVNVVSFDQSVLNQLTVRSDFSNPNGIADGTSDVFHFTLNGGTLSVTFNDKGDVATTPDTGSTFGLLALALAALFGASRFRAPRLA